MLPNPRTEEMSETRGLEDRKEVTAGDRLKALNRYGCALTYMNAPSRQNLSGVLMRDVSLVGNWARYERCIRGCHGRGAVLPDECDMHVGRERPPLGGARGEVGGRKVGVAHAPDASSSAANSRADSDTGGTKRRPRQRSETTHSQGHRPIDLHPGNVHATACFDGEPRVEQGEHSSRVCVPPVLSSIEVKQSGNQEVRRGPPERRGLRLRGPVRTLQRQHPYASADRLAQLDSEVVHHVAAHMRVREAGLQEPPDIRPVMRNNIVA